MNIAEHTVGAWPTSDLQALGCCPACGHLERRSLMQGLTDVVFRAAPGQWEMWRCGECGTAYLDPRPDEKSIGRAYSRYYTHAGNASLHSPLRLQDRGLRAAARRLRNGYLNARYGHALDGWTSFGWMLPLIAPKAARRADHLIRHLPPSNGSDRLLDVGCGSGEWLATARLLGYQVFGLEPDVTAAATAAANGYDVRSGVVPGSGYRDALFDQVTLNHVFEHLHWPVDALNELHRILKPGGRLWISMPNLSAQGLRQFERHWRGLEVPRHLSLYDPSAIQRLLEACRFCDVKLLPPVDNAEFYYRQSVAIQHGRDPYAGEDPDWTPAWRRKAQQADELACRNPIVGESLTIVGFKNA